MTASDVKKAVLVCQGSFSPVHFNHLTIIESAKQALGETNRPTLLISSESKHGYTILTGILAPVADSFLSKKLNGKYITLSERCEVIRRAVNDPEYANRFGWIQADESGLTTKALMEKYFDKFNKDGEEVIIIKVRAG